MTNMQNFAQNHKTLQKLNTGFGKIYMDDASNKPKLGLHERNGNEKDFFVFNRITGFTIHGWNEG
jgi:hypothetical protein